MVHVVQEVLSEGDGVGDDVIIDLEDEGRLLAAALRPGQQGLRRRLVRRIRLSDVLPIQWTVVIW